MLTQSQELEKFKSEVNLAEFIVAHGATVLSRSTSNSYRIRYHDEIYLVSIKNHVWLFYCVTDDTKRGSIIDFCNTVLGITNLGLIRKYIRRYLERKPHIYTNINVKPSTNVDIDVYSKDLKYDKWRIYSHRVWAERCINVSFIKSVLNNVAVDLRGNLCFKIFDNGMNVIGYEVKGLNGFKQNIGSKQGIAVAGDYNSDTAVICESMFDCLSYFELHGSPDNPYLLFSLSGQLTETQLLTLYQMVTRYSRLNRLSNVIVATDNDAQGCKYAQRIRNTLLPLSLNLDVHYSTMKDWNDELKLRKQSGKAESVSLIA